MQSVSWACMIAGAAMALLLGYPDGHAAETSHKSKPRATVVTSKGSNRLLARLDQNEHILRTFNRATVMVHPSRRVTPAAEWLLDNFYLIEEQIQMARRGI